MILSILSTQNITFGKVLLYNHETLKNILNLRSSSLSVNVWMSTNFRSIESTMGGAYDSVLRFEWSRRILAWCRTKQVSSLFAVDTFRHFGPRILNLQIKSSFLNINCHFGSFFLMWLSVFTDKKSANNEGLQYFLTFFISSAVSIIGRTPRWLNMS